MTTLDLDALERAARAATPGPWIVRETKINGVTYGGHWVEGIDLDPEDARYPERLVKITGSGGAQSYTTRIFEPQIHDDNEANAAFIALANPAAILSLISDYRALQERVEGAEKDKARLDFLDHCNHRLNEYCGTTYRWRMIMSHNVNRLMLRDVNTVDLHDSDANGSSSCRGAIDAEMHRLRAARTKAGEPHEQE